MIYHFVKLLLNLRNVFLSQQTGFMTHAEPNFQDPKGQLYFLLLLSPVQNGTVCIWKTEQNLSPQQSAYFFSPTENKPDIPTSLIRIHRELAQLGCIRYEYSVPRYSWSGMEVQLSLLAVSTKKSP